MPIFIYKDKYRESNDKFRRPSRKEKQTGCLRQKFGWTFNEFLGQKFIKSDSPHHIPLMPFFIYKDKYRESNDIKLLFKNPSVDF